MLRRITDTKPAANGANERIGCNVPGDLNGDGAVNVLDLMILLGAWGTNVGHPADLDGDGVVNVSDLLTLLSNWG